MSEIVGVPGGAEIWRDSDTGRMYVVYFTPVDTRAGDGLPGVPVMFYITSPKELEAFFEVGVTPKANREFTSEQLKSMGAITFGTARELVGTEDNPLAQLAIDLENSAEFAPWLLDEDYLQLLTGASLEGRALSTEELKRTEWYQNTTDGEREWMLLFHDNQLDAQLAIEENRAAVREMLKSAGFGDFTDELVNTLADQVTTGKWTQGYLQRQVLALSDPSSGHTVDPMLQKKLTGKENTTRDSEAEVEAMVLEWLGPAYMWDDKTIAHWAGKVRNDPDGMDNLIDVLQGQRMAVFPGYDNPNLTYNNIAQPWKNVWNRVWGRTPDETDPLFLEIVNMNDLATANKLLLKEGMKRGVGQVVDGALGGLRQVLGDSVQRSAV